MALSHSQLTIICCCHPDSGNLPDQEAWSGRPTQRGKPSKVIVIRPPGRSSHLPPPDGVRLAHEGVQVLVARHDLVLEQPLLPDAHLQRGAPLAERVLGLLT